MTPIGWPHLHLRSTTSTNDRARELASSGAPHGTLISTDQQTAGRGRQGREWIASAGSAALISLIIRNPPELLPLIAAVAVAEACGPDAEIKWPNDILLTGPDNRAGKVAGILCEGRPQEGWSVVGIGVNVGPDVPELPEAGGIPPTTLALEPHQRSEVIDRIKRSLGEALELPGETLLQRWRERDALRGKAIEWQDQNGPSSGTASGINDRGELLVECSDGERVALNAGEVHLTGEVR